MNTIEQIDVNTEMTADDFCALFEQLPLNDEERKDVREGYYPIYKTFIGNEVAPVTAWAATKNIFVIKNKQLVERIQQNG